LRFKNAGTLREARQKVAAATRKYKVAKVAAKKTRSAAKQTFFAKKIRPVRGDIQQINKKVVAAKAKAPAKIKAIKLVVLALSQKARDAVRTQKIEKTKAAARTRLVNTFKPKKLKPRRLSRKSKKCVALRRRFSKARRAARKNAA